MLGYLRYSETACTTGMLLWIDGRKLLRKNRQGRRGKRVVFHVREQLRCMKLNGTQNRLVEILWFRIRGETSKGNIMVSLLQITQSR